MKINKKFVTGTAFAAMLSTSIVPYAVMADAPEAPPLFNHQAEKLLVNQIAQYDSGQGEGGTEIMAYDVKRHLAFVTNGAAGGFDILSFADLESGKFTKVDSSKRVLLSEFGIDNVDDITSIASHPTEDLIAISAVSDPKTDAGNIVFVTKDGKYVNHVEVGSLPDMVTFTPDGTKAVVANEGEPSGDPSENGEETYSVDPEGSISIINMEDFSVNTLYFEETQLDDKVRVSSKGTVKQQIEPEFVTISDDSNTAYISLQENNAIATVDLVNGKIVDVKGLGIKDHSALGNELDAVKDGEISIEKQPILAFHMPDGIDTFIANGKTYILTPNEGDARDYDAYSEEKDLADIMDQVELNADHYEGYTQEELDAFVTDGGLERLADYKITTENGLNDEGKYEAIYGYGGRSFSIFEAETMELVYDSGSDFESIIAEVMPEHFNITNDELGMDDRSDNKGPEPESVTTGEIDGKTYAFIALERFSGIMVYDLSDPTEPEYVTLVSSRDFSADVAGDVSPEGLQFISAEESPTGNALLAATHEVSGTVAVYEFNGEASAEPSPEEPSEQVEYSDVKPEDVHYEGIMALTERGIVTGYQDGTFKQWSGVKREHVALMLYRTLNLDAPNDVDAVLAGYDDVNDASRYAKEIAAVTEANIFSGKDGEFMPNDPITREQMASVVNRAFELEPYVTEDVAISLDNVDPSHKENVKVLANLGITDQTDDFRPKEDISRAAFSTLLHRTLQTTEDNGGDNFELSIMHANDTHANLDNMPLTLTAVKELRAEKPDSLLLHAGDVFTGTLYFNEFEGKADLALLKLLNFDAMTFGNHEFDLGSSAEGHQALVDFIQGANFPFVSSNVDFSGDDKFTGLFSDLISSEPEDGKIYNGMIKEIDGEKVGIFGLTTAETADISSPGNIKFEDYLEEAEKAVKAFEGQGVDKIIALTHIGYDDNPAYDNDQVLAEEVEGIDVIVGGHSHTQLDEPVVVDKDGTPTIIVQAYQYNDYLGTLDVEFDENGIVVGYAGELISIGEQTPDPEAAEILAPYAEQVEAVSLEEIGVTLDHKLENPRTAGDEDTASPSVRKNETILGNLITDGMLNKSKEYNENVVMAFQNGGGIREAIDAGPITVGEVIIVLPFGNTLATMEVTGAELKEAFEISFGSFPYENGGFLHVAGAQVQFDSSKPTGERVVSISYENEDDTFTEVQDSETYTIATNAFTAKGGDGYTVFAKAYDEGRVTDLGLSDWENLREQFISLEKIPTETEGRIVDIAN